MVRCLVDYLYQGAYKLPPTTLEDQDPGAAILSAHATLFALAEQYLIDGLKAVAAKNYERALRNNPNANDFLHSLGEVYRRTPSNVRELRNIAVLFAKENLAASLSSKDTKTLYDDIAEDIPDFVKDLADSYLKRSRDYCLDCGTGPPWAKRRKVA